MTLRLVADDHADDHADAAVDDAAHAASEDSAQPAGSTPRRSPPARQGRRQPADDPIEDEEVAVDSTIPAEGVPTDSVSRITDAFPGAVVLGPDDGAGGR